MSDNGHRPGDDGHNPAPDFGAQEGRMRASEHDIELSAFATELRDAYARPPAAAVADAHVEAMLAEADAIAATAVLEPPAPRGTRPTNGWAVVRRLALVPLAVLAAGGGLAVAGVRPPEPISDAFEGVGIDVPGSDGEDSAADHRRERNEGSEDRGDDGAESPNGSAQGGANSANDGPTPGAGHSNSNAAEGQRTAEQARSGQTPPDEPGRSGDHPAPQGNGSPPEDPGHPGQGKPDSPPGQSHSSAQDHGGENADKPVKPDKEKPDKESSES